MSTDSPNSPNTDQGSSSKELRDRAAQDVDHVTSKAKHDLDAVTKRAEEDARQLGQQAKETLGDATNQAKTFASDQKALAASQINGIASAIEKVAGELDGSDQQAVARYARDLARGLSGLGKTLEDKDVDDLMGMAQDFGRTQPVAFLGASALAGFAASRFAKASAHRRENRPSDTNSATGGAGSEGQRTSQATSIERTGGF